MTDVLLICQKELREVFTVRGPRAAYLVTMTAQVGVFGGLIPYFQAPAWLAETAILAFIFLLLPMTISFSQSAAVFAGERERSTLESLLATPLSVRALFFGKALAVVLQVYAMVVAATLVSIGVLNLWAANNGLGTFMYTPPALFALLVVSLTVSVFAVSLGVIISLRAPSVRTAQTLTTLLSILCLVPLMTGWVTIRFEWGFVLTAAVGLAAIDILVTIVALARFGKAAAISGRG